MDHSRPHQVIGIAGLLLHQTEIQAKAESEHSRRKNHTGGALVLGHLDGGASAVLLLVLVVPDSGPDLVQLLAA